MMLESKTAIVTGAGRGIGRAIARALAAEGASVVIADIDGDSAVAVQQEIEAAGGTALGLAVDVTCHADVEEMIRKVVERFGHLDILVNNAGWDKVQPFLESHEDVWDKVISINYKGMLNFCHSVLPYMAANGGGKVINISSDAGRVGSTGEAVYAGCKGAVIAFSKSLAREVARHGITVNVICPGLTETALLDESRAAMPKVIDAISRSIPLRRIGQPEDIASAAVFFSAPVSDYITGQVLSVSGGLTMAG